MELKMSIQLLNNKLLREFALVFFASLILNVTCLSVAHSQVMPGVASFISAVSQPNAKGSSTSQILLEIPKGNLCETLSDLNEKSGIEFKCPDRLQDHVLLPRVLKESNWVSLIRVLLEDYNVIEIWNQKGEMTQVYLVGNKEWSAPIIQTTQSTGVVKTRSVKDNKTVAESIEDGTPGSNLSKSQLFVLLQTSTYRPMPSHLFNSAEFQEVLSFAQIETPQDWLDLKKSKIVKEQVQKLLKLKKK